MENGMDLNFSLQLCMHKSKYECLSKNPAKFISCSISRDVFPTTSRLS